MPAPRKPIARRQQSNQAPAQRLWNIRNDANGIPTIEVFGDIGASREGDPYWGIEGGAGTFQEFAAELKKIGPVPELRVEIHSYGGSVMVGKGIHDKLREHPANKTAVIYGVCASAATYAALACETVQIPANSFFLIHNSTGMCWGNASDMVAMSENLEIIDQSIADLYAARTGKTAEEMRDIMDKDTWITGTDAVAIGLADEVIEPITIDPATRAKPENFRREALNHMPDSARLWFDSRTLPTPANSAPPIMPTPATPSAPAPAPAPAAASAPAPAAPTNVVPQAPAPAPAPAPVVAPAPTNAAPSFTLADITAAITNAVAPLQQRLDVIEQQRQAGITPQNLAGAPPATDVTPPEAPQKIDMTNMSPMQLINLGRTKLMNQGKTVPLAQ